MRINATRLGRIFGAEMGPDWMVSHAAYPVPLILSDGQLRLFLVTRDKENRGAVGFIDLDPSNPLTVTSVSDELCLGPGELGAFDDRGISIGSVHRIGTEVWMYYLGWNLAVDIPFRNAIGLATSSDETGTSLFREFLGPIVDRSRFDPFSLSYPFVIPAVEGSGEWRMYYGTSRSGGKVEDMHHVITVAISRDGIDWEPTGQDVIGLKAGEFGVSRPWISRIGNETLLFFSIRRATYTIGVARWNAQTGEFERMTDDLLGRSGELWETEANCYAAVIEFNDQVLMFYNGNGYGRTGVGVAQLHLED